MSIYLKKTLFLFLIQLLVVSSLFAQPSSLNGPVEINGDVIEYSTEGSVMIVKGNVVMKGQSATLTCDRVEFSQITQVAKAEGNVLLKTDQGEIFGRRLTYNFKDGSGDFNGAKLYAHPYYGSGDKVDRVSDDLIVMKNAYITTSDFDKPEYRVTSKKIEVYPGNKLVARNVMLKIGKVPVMFIPRFTQNLNDKKPKILFTPGYDKQWGGFLLSKYRYYFNEDVKGTFHLDYRERKDLAEGADLEYNSEKFGDGIIRTYYMNERQISAKHFYKEKLSPTTERERFKAEWRHKWDLDEDKKTTAILQYYKLSDSQFLKDYFEREYDNDSNPSTYFLLTQALPKGTFSFRTEGRVNRFEATTERLPELKYILDNQEIAETNLYYRNETSYNNFSKKSPSPSDFRLETMRIDSDHEVSYPMKLSIIEFTPYIGGRNTYYSKTIDPEKYGAVRGIFKSGAKLQTKFYRIFEDVDIDTWGLDIHRLRHVLTPQISYSYNTKPTLLALEIDQFDSLDSLDINHSITFGLENKLQTKRGDDTVELLRALLETDFRLKEHPDKPGFDDVRFDMDFRPIDWLTLYADATYTTRREHLKTANFDISLQPTDRWVLDVGKRFNHDVDDVVSTEFRYRINPKWQIRAYTRVDTKLGNTREQEFTLSRDLHSWIMDMNFNQTKGQGSEIWLVFTLKAFPEMGLDLGTSFNKPKRGSSSDSSF